MSIYTVYACIHTVLGTLGKLSNRVSVMLSHNEVAFNDI